MMQYVIPVAQQFVVLVIEVYMEYRNIEFDKIAKSEQQLQSLSFIGINYNKKLKKALTEEYKNPSIVDINMLKDLEDKYNLVLTEEYKNFLLETNGGVPSKSIFDLTKKKDVVIGHFFTLYSKVEMYTLENNNNSLISFPMGYFSIGDTVNGDYILINLILNDSDYGAIFIFFHEKDELKKVSNSFNEFLDKLHD
ncbi:SMI1/KNR4 family protein [Acinetobacter baumannii]|nr:SMI1/KNR4 family protein [Acinetobacter baumannii]RYL25433.1 SMI1/KNR4 family protein [Acinetobacter baumannii]RYL41264.1 SMI1/KNR4 family protein [Acinetobacter baumannii]